MAAVAARYNDLQDLGVEVISLSVDSQFVHMMWEEHELSKMVDGGIPWKMGSDGTGAVGKVYGVFDEDAGVELRGRFIIDPDGVIQAAETLTPPVGRNIDETIRQVKAFQRVRESGGTEATPAEWQPGQETLKPGPDMVGKIWKVWKPNGQ